MTLLVRASKAPAWLKCPDCLRARGYSEAAIALDPDPCVCSEHAQPPKPNGNPYLARLRAALLRAVNGGRR